MPWLRCPRGSERNMRIRWRNFELPNRVTIDEEFSLSGSIERSQVEAKLNGGGEELSLETSGGNIRVGVR